MSMHLFYFPVRLVCLSYYFWASIGRMVVHLIIMIQVCEMSFLPISACPIPTSQQTW